MNKTISQFTETTAPEEGDLFLLQRGVDGKYYSISVENLGGGIFKSTVTLSDTELEALNATPIEIIAAQGTSTYIDIVSALAYRNGAAFTATDPQMKLVFSGQTQAHFQTGSGFLTDSGATMTHKFIPVSAGVKLFSNTGVNAYLTNDVQTATGPVTIQVIYRVFTAS